MSWTEEYIKSSGYFVVDIFRAFDGQVKANVEQLYSLITTQFCQIAALITAFYILTVSMLLIRGRISEAQKEFTASIFLLISIVPFVFDSQLYMDTFVRTFTNTVFDLAGLLASAGENKDMLAPLRNLQDIFYKYASYAEFLEGEGTMTGIMFNMKLAAAILILGICLLGSGITFFLMILYNMFMVYIMFIVGGPSLFFLSFAKTRHIFWGWLRGVFTFAMTIIMAALISSVSIFAIEGSVDELYRTKETGIFTEAYLATVLIAILTWYALKKTTYVVAMFVGGMENASHGISAVAGGVVGGVVGSGLASTKKAAGTGLSGAGGIASGIASVATGFAGSASAIYRQMRG